MSQAGFRNATGVPREDATGTKTLMESSHLVRFTVADSVTSEETVFLRMRRSGRGSAGLIRCLFLENMASSKPCVWACYVSLLTSLTSDSHGRLIHVAACASTGTLVSSHA